MARPKAPTPTLPEAPEGADATYEPGQFNPFVHALLKQASDLRTERDDLTTKTRANRESLYNALGTGLLSEAQATAIAEWYPRKDKSADEAAEGTDEAKTEDTEAKAEDTEAKTTPAKAKRS